MAGSPWKAIEAEDVWRQLQSFIWVVGNYQEGREGVYE